MSGWILYFTYCLIRYFVNDYTSYIYTYKGERWVVHSSFCMFTLENATGILK